MAKKTQLERDTEALAGRVWAGNWKSVWGTVDKFMVRPDSVRSALCDEVRALANRTPGYGPVAGVSDPDILWALFRWRKAPREGPRGSKSRVRS